MNPVTTPDPESTGETHPEPREYGPITYLEYWPAIVAALLLSMGILGLAPAAWTPDLLWIPIGVLAGLLLLAVFAIPRIGKPREEDWEIRAREATEAAHQFAFSVQQQAAAAVQATEPEKTAAPSPTESPAAAPAAANAPVPAGDVEVLILWGSETGTAQGLAEMTEGKLKASGVSARATSMGQVKLDVLPGYKKVLVITSTWGDGEPPSNAIDLWEDMQKRKVDMSNTRFSVLSLGDTAYPQFCKCGKDFDQFLESHGAQRLHPRVDCDLDYEANFEKWLSGVQSALK